LTAAVRLAGRSAGVRLGGSRWTASVPGRRSIALALRAARASAGSRSSAACDPRAGRELERGRGHRAQSLGAPDDEPALPLRQSVAFRFVGATRAANWQRGRLPRGARNRSWPSPRARWCPA
jgi:hypothetical protein